MKLQTVLFEWQLTIVEHAPYLRLGVRYNVFVLNSQYLARQNFVPMIHYLHIVTIITTNIGEAIGKALPTGEELCVATKTGRHWMAAGIDNLGVRKHQTDKTNMQKVVGHFVDEKRSFASLNTSSIYILLPQFIELAGV